MVLPSIQIIILNWKKPEDTIECLSSLEQISYKNYGIIIIDNDSKDDSVEKLENWLRASKYEFKKNRITDNISDLTNQIDTTKEVQLIINNENSGFAKGNNIGIELALSTNTDYVLLLNNDTEVTEDFLDKLIEEKTNNPNMSVLTPQIRLYKPKDILWNCGGKLILGGFWKKYYYPFTHIKHLKEKELVKPITFVTGCALLYDPRELGKLTEDFFFGEEDFELSLRVRKMDKKMGCVMDSIIYHKVGTSLDNVNTIGKRYIHILNRLINTRKNNFNLSWPFLALAIVFYNFIGLLRKENLGIRQALSFSHSLLKDSIKMDKVGRDKFIDILYIREW